MKNSGMFSKLINYLKLNGNLLSKHKYLDVTLMNPDKCEPGFNIVINYGTGVINFECKEKTNVIDGNEWIIV